MTDAIPREVSIRRLGPEDAAAFRAGRLEALETHPTAFATSAEAWRAAGADSVRSFLETPDRVAIFGAFGPDGLVGLAGVKREEREAVRHVATLWGVFVRPAWRRRGVGGALVQAALDAARAFEGAEQVRLMAPATAVEALSVFAAQGFERYGLEPRARRYGDTYVDQAYMIRFLDGDAA